jgi:hypothetical protein
MCLDEELPDYVMVLVANRRTKAQMDSDLSLFLGENTVKFTTWLCHVLKKLEQVTMSGGGGPAEPLPNIELVEEVGSKAATTEKKRKKESEKPKKGATTEKKVHKEPKSKPEGKVQFKLKRPLLGKSDFEVQQEEERKALSLL